MILIDYKTLLRNQLVLVILLVSVLSWGNISLNKKNNNLQAELSEIDFQFSAITTTTSDFEEMEKRYEEEIEEFKSRASIFQTEHEYLNFIRHITEMAQKYNLTLSRLEPFLDDVMPDIKKYQTFNLHKMERYKTRFILSGRFLDTGKFLESLDRVREGIHVNICNIRKAKTGTQEIKTNVTVCTYRVSGP